MDAVMVVSGVLMGIKLREAFGDTLDFWIFEKNEDVGGTWFENRYPGCACDVPSHVYQYSFCPNPYWSKVYCNSSEIQAYIRAVAYHYGIDKYISYKSPVNKAVWDEVNSKWIVSVEGHGDLECDILFNGTGILNNYSYPKVKGLDRFKGPTLHTAAWDDSVDLAGKRVAIIGAGASAIQTLPAIVDNVDHVDIYIRTPSWITSPMGNHLKDGDLTYSREEQLKFRDDPDYSLNVRKKMEHGFNVMYKAFVKESEQQQILHQKIKEHMKEKIADPELQEKVIPKFEVGCRRVNPGFPYLEALQRPNVTPVFDPIDEVTAKGVVAGGKARDVDVLITATGFDTSFRPRFPIVGRGGRDLQDMWRDSPEAYFGLAVHGFPNYLVFLGPNSPVAGGSLMGVIEAKADFFSRLIGKMIDEQAVTFEEAMEKMVWTGACRSWYKGEDGKVRALWPGSVVHYREQLEANHWEHFDWKYRGNRFAFWGQGFSKRETSGEEEPDLAYYFKKADPLPLEAYYLAAKGNPNKPKVSSSFSRNLESEVASLSVDSDSDGSLV
ncbi:FAD/NAD(P)-binding domain-containing protein [Sporormia fimetaria CBS 119925]|uniref:FAD/NAD(P)-binding domain-containing protein n=1 Tax=Sporormia fimetaria CBS 119925 TaxID=1340428 RepID=A0A6A6UV25_9PLEO|nr:FAD/NAD(P)-binding domain-containing protein [Sporormia fimetaria CBS 119925]